ncbi:MAG TPA: hypothetical protein PLB32_24625 [Acidobacteriota bacterium]|nr:hypothetical protein [Acidobacteriota bacterium]HNG96010.1 hypothetical protein [Acidobacteriota bacterium]
MAAVLPKPELWPVVLRFDLAMQMMEAQFFYRDLAIKTDNKEF